MKGSKVRASYESNDLDEYHMALGDPIKMGQKVMDAAGIIPTDTQGGDTKNVFMKMKHKHFADKAGRRVSCSCLS